MEKTFADEVSPNTTIRVVVKKSGAVAAVTNHRSPITLVEALKGLFGDVQDVSTWTADNMQEFLSIKEWNAERVIVEILSAG